MTKVEYIQAVKDGLAVNYQRLLGAVVKQAWKDAKTGDSEALVFLQVATPDLLTLDLDIQDRLADSLDHWMT